jgi:PadR family transcriptional regulator PadR
MYPLLRALEREGFLSSFEGETVPERGGRPRIYYELTGMGRRAAFDERGDSQVAGVGLVPVLS